MVLVPVRFARKAAELSFALAENANRTPPPCTLIANQGFLRIQEDLTEDLCKDVTVDFLQRCEKQIVQ